MAGGLHELFPINMSPKINGMMLLCVWNITSNNQKKPKVPSSI